MFSAVAKQDGGRQWPKRNFGSSSLLTGVDNCLSESICHYIQLDISNTATASYDSPTKSHCHHFQVSNSEEEDQTWSCSQIMASTRTKGGERLQNSLLPADSRSLLWTLHFENNIGPPRCTSVSSPSSLGRDIQNCRPFELLVDIYKVRRSRHVVSQNSSPGPSPVSRWWVGKLGLLRPFTWR